MILKNISFKTGKNEKIGIVGRTGAGKSSLITALFRLSEPTGKILIDNINITDMGLNHLRKSISIIPQGKSVKLTLLLEIHVKQIDLIVQNNIFQTHSYSHQILEKIWILLMSIETLKFGTL